MGPLYYFGGLVTAVLLFLSLSGHVKRREAALAALISFPIWPFILLFIAYLGKKEVETA